MSTPSSSSELATPVQPRTVKVSYIRHPQSLKSQNPSLSMKRRPSNNVIHVTVGLPHNTRPITDSSFTPKDNSISSMEYELKNSFITPNSIVNPTDTISSSIQQYTEENEDLNNSSIDQQRNVNNLEEPNHQKEMKSKECHYTCLCVSLIVICILIIIIATILAVLLPNKPVKIVRPPNPVSLRWNSYGITIAGMTGVSGASPSLLNYPYGLAFDSSGTLYIADLHNNRIQKLITDTSICVTVAGDTNGSPGNTANRLNLPVDILFDSDDNMYITDRGNTRVQLWAKDATSGTTIAGIGGTSNISFTNPSGISADPNSGTLFIADTSSQRIVSYPAGTVVAGGNGQGNAVTQLDDPYGLAYDSISNSFVIPNYSSHNIVRWVLGATNRTHVAGNINGTAGSTSTSLQSPVGITMDPMGNIYVADSDNHRIQFFLAGQSNAITITGTTSVFGTNSNQLNVPYWVILANQLNLYVSDTYNHRIQKFVRY